LIYKILFLFIVAIIVYKGTIKLSILCNKIESFLQKSINDVMYKAVEPNAEFGINCRLRLIYFLLVLETLFVFDTMPVSIIKKHLNRK